MIYSFSSSANNSFGTRLKNLTSKMTDRIVMMIKMSATGRETKIFRDPPLIDKDCRNAPSNISPKINPKIKGAKGHPFFFIAYPSTPKIKAIHTSNMVLRGE